MLEKEKLLAEGNKAHDAKVNWGLRQVSQLSQREEREKFKLDGKKVIN